MAVKLIFLQALFLCVAYMAHAEKLPDEPRGCINQEIEKHVSILKKRKTASVKDGEDLYAYKLHQPFHQRLSGYIPEQYREKFKDEHDLRVFFPATIWIPDKYMYLAVVRVALLRRTSFIYATFLDSEYNEVREEDYIGKTRVPGVLPIPCDWEINNSGPEDPRMFRALGNEIFLIFNMLQPGTTNRKMWLYRFATRETRMLAIPAHHGAEYVIEKNWTPLVVDDTRLFFVFNYQDFQVYDCTENKDCVAIRGSFDDLPPAVRGGTPYVKFRNNDYYVSFVFTHIEMQDDRECDIYRPALSIVKYVKDYNNFKLVFTSDPLEFGKKLFMHPITDITNVDDLKYCSNMRILIPVSVSKMEYDEDIVNLAMFVNDLNPVAIKITGLVKFIDDVIRKYESGEMPLDDNCAEQFAHSFYSFPTTIPVKGRPEHYK